MPTRGGRTSYLGNPFIDIMSPARFIGMRETRAYARSVPQFDAAAKLGYKPLRNARVASLPEPEMDLQPHWGMPLSKIAAEFQDIFPSECRRRMAHHEILSMALVPSLQVPSAVAPGKRKKPLMPNRGLRNAPKRNERLQVMLSDVELKVIDAWRFDAMMPSRAAAIRTLIRKGLEASGMDMTAVIESADSISDVPKSDDIGIV